MIVIKIKTWKDWKKDFLEWVKAPRQKECKNYVYFLEGVCKTRMEKELEDAMATMGINEYHQSLIILHAHNAIDLATKETCKLIEDCQPKY